MVAESVNGPEISERPPGSRRDLQVLGETSRFSDLQVWVLGVPGSRSSGFSELRVLVGQLGIYGYG